MKNLIIATAAVFGLSGLTGAEEARAGKKGKIIARKILGAVVNHAIHGKHGHGGHGHWGPGHGHPGHGGGVRPLPRPRRYFHVKYHMHGTRRKHTHSHSLAHRWERYLRTLGFHAKVVHIGDHYDVVYHLHRRRQRTFRSHRAAHSFERQVERVGAHARVSHR